MLVHRRWDGHDGCPTGVPVVRLTAYGACCQWRAAVANSPVAAGRHALAEQTLHKRALVASVCGSMSASSTRTTTHCGSGTPRAASCSASR